MENYKVSELFRNRIYRDAAKTVGGSNHSSVGEGCSGKVVLER